MSIALVIPTADFSDNAMEQIIVTEPVPCTGITLNQSTGEITAIGDTLTLIPTVTPLDTTDTITWASSDDTVATVSNGVVTTVGVGTATITASCGIYSASCTITSKAFMDTDNVLKRVGYYLAGNTAVSGGNGLADWRTQNVRHGGLASSTGRLRFYGIDPYIYPYVLPTGTKKIKITVPADSTISKPNLIQWFNHTTAASGQSEYVKLIQKQGNLTGENGVYVVDVATIDDYPEIDSFVVSFIVPEGQTMTEEMLNSVTVEFLAN